MLGWIGMVAGAAVSITIGAAPVRARGYDAGI